MRERPQPMRLTKLARSARGALAGALCALGCGSAEHNAIPPVPEADAGADSGAETHVASAVNLCPHVDGSFITPQKIAPKVRAVVAVTASDPDSTASDLTFAWRATSGVFSASNKPVTDYECSKIGTQQLTVTVTDQPGCGVEFTINVECVQG